MTGNTNRRECRIGEEVLAGFPGNIFISVSLSSVAGRLFFSVVKVGVI
jgi:hypothetical protein